MRGRHTDTNRKHSGNTILDVVSLETPPFTRDTTGWWIDVPKDTLHAMRLKGFNTAEGLHSAAHAILNQFDMQKELKTECKVASKEYKPTPSKRKRPARCVDNASLYYPYSYTLDRLMFYDAAGRHGGVAAKAFDHGNTLHYCRALYFFQTSRLKLQPQNSCMQPSKRSNPVVVKKVVRNVGKSLYQSSELIFH
jgi:hypothetical protein